MSASGDHSPFVAAAAKELLDMSGRVSRNLDAVYFSMWCDKVVG